MNTHNRMNDFFMTTPFKDSASIYDAGIFGIVIVDTLNLLKVRKIVLEFAIIGIVYAKSYAIT